MPKRILALDGGGINAFFTIQILEKVEAIYRARFKDPNLVLADVFSLIAGTSTGAILGSFLAWGLSVEEVGRMYRTHSAQMFRRGSMFPTLRNRYREEPIAAFLQNVFREEDGTLASFGSPRLRSLLLLVLRNGTTGSPWPLCNNPRARFNQADLADCNLKLPLWQLVRASTAAPTYFPPERIDLGGESFEFIDGGVSPYNNPAHIALLMATLPCYRMQWEKGADKLFLLSVGTGMIRPRARPGAFQNMRIPGHIKSVIHSLMYSNTVQQDVFCRYVAHTLYGDEIDGEVGDLRDANDAASGQCSYTRYNRLYDTADIEVMKQFSRRPFALDNLELVPYVTEQGKQYAERTVSPAHLP